jgi:hypothetical protein
MACQLLEVLVSTDAGRDCLKENKLIGEIVDLLKLEVASQVRNSLIWFSFFQKGDEVAKNKADRLLNPENVLKTMAREYFTMLGTLSSSPRGLEVLSKFQVFKYLIESAELPGRDDLCHLIMTSLDYNM